MAKDKFSEEQKEVIRAQNDALLRLPDDRDARLALIHNYRMEKARENDLIAQAKKEVGSSETLKRLTSANGLKPQAIKFIGVLAELAAPDRSAALRQVINHGEDAGWIIPDLFDRGAVGVGSNDEAGATFDKTTTGQRQGGTAAQPRTTEQMAASNAGPAPTPGLDLSTPEARAAVIQKYEEAAAARKGQRGPKPPEFKELQANHDAAKAAEAKAKAQPETVAEEPVAELPAEGADTEASNVVPIGKQMRQASEAGDAHIREQAARLAAGRDGKTAADNTAPAPEKPKRASRKKDTPTPPPADAAPASDGPTPPPADEDDDEPDFRSAPVGAHQVGDQPSSYTVR